MICFGIDFILSKILGSKSICSGVQLAIETHSFYDMYIIIIIRKEAEKEAQKRKNDDDEEEIINISFIDQFNEVNK